MALILLDSCVWGGALAVLRECGHDVTWSGSWSKDPGDRAILSAAHLEKRILITLDKDFGELAVLKGSPHFGIVRLTGFRAEQMADVIDRIVNRHHSELIAGAIITVDPKRVRIRSACD